MFAHIERRTYLLSGINKMSTHRIHKNEEIDFFPFNTRDANHLCTLKNHLIIAWHIYTTSFAFFFERVRTGDDVSKQGKE